MLLGSPPFLSRDESEKLSTIVQTPRPMASSRPVQLASIHRLQYGFLCEFEGLAGEAVASLPQDVVVLRADRGLCYWDGLRLVSTRIRASQVSVLASGFAD